MDGRGCVCRVLCLCSVGARHKIEDDVLGRWALIKIEIIV